MPGNIITENGWPECEFAQTQALAVPGTSTVKIACRAGDAATVLTAWAAWLHRNVRSIEPSDGHRNWWGWSEDNEVFTSNHKSGTAIDLCSDELPWKHYTMPQDQVDKVHQGLSLFEGNVFWGRDWGAGQQDEMHFQCGYNTWNNPRFAEFAQRLRDGYLNIYGPLDPLAFPLPMGYYYGPLQGPEQSISGEFESDSQFAKDGLGRWQAKLGLPVTKKWNDGRTPQAATTLQLAKGWPPNPAFGYGGVYLGEWNAVMKEGWRLPAGWDPLQVANPEVPLVKWGDYSQHQGVIVNDSYPYKAICFRASIADSTATTADRYGGIDRKFVENMARAKEMVASGKLEKVIAYHFWVPGFDNWGTFKAAIDATGGVFPELAFMIDVEDGGPHWNVRGNQSLGVNEFIRKGQELFVNPFAASIYVNFNANPDLLPVASLPQGVKIIVPRYAGPDKPPAVPAGVSVFGHQYADDESTAPFGPTDINQSHMTFTAWLESWGTNGGVVMVRASAPAGAAAPFTDDDRVLLNEVRAMMTRYFDAESNGQAHEEVPADNRYTARTKSGAKAPGASAKKAAGAAKVLAGAGDKRSGY